MKRKIDEAAAFICEERETLFPVDDVDTDDPVYECGECGEVFKRSESEYDSHRCSCGRFASKLHDFGCPDCSGELAPLFRDEA